MRKYDFPIFEHHPDLIYLDNAATTQKPKSVIDCLTQFYQNDYATIHRGVYQLSQAATQKVDDSRLATQRFVNAQHVEEIIFTRGTTEAINLVARSFAATQLKPGQTILVTELDHHANWVPWQQIAKEKGLGFEFIPINDRGEIDLEAAQKMIKERNVGLLALSHVSNALGTINPIEILIPMAKAVGAKVLIDGAQAASHVQIDVQALDCDFYCFSGHKCYGPTGIGVLYGKKALLKAMPPYQFGGDMVETVTQGYTTFAQLPEKFEAGTPPIAEIIALKPALEYLQGIGFLEIHRHEEALLIQATQALQAIPDLQIIGTAAQKAAVISFIMEGIHPHDIGTILDAENIAIRAGHHCAQPVMQHFQIPATARASFGVYNTSADVDRLVAAIEKVRTIFK